LTLGCACETEKNPFYAARQNEAKRRFCFILRSFGKRNGTMAAASLESTMRWVDVRFPLGFLTRELWKPLLALEKPPQAGKPLPLRALSGDHFNK
jgi:hypothetical protein